MLNSFSKTVLVYGATGAIGTNLIEIMSKNNPSWKILAATRSGGASSYLASLELPNVELIKGNVEDLQQAREQTKGVDMVFSCIGFPQYETKYWALHWPVVVDNLLAVTSSERPLVFCDNLYAYGPTTDITTSTPTVPPSLKSKPGVRAILRQKFQQRIKSDPNSIVIVGGADFFGPRLEGKTFLGDPMIGKLTQGERPMAMASADSLHDFCYAKDFANALYLASSKPDISMGKFWICPHTVHDMTLRQVSEYVQTEVMERNKVAPISVLSPFMIRTLGLFMGFMRELKEMMAFWKNDYTIDDSEFCKAFGVEPTPMKVAFSETVAYYQDKKESK